MTIPFPIVFRTLLEDLGRRHAAGRLDADDMHAASVLVALSHAIAAGPGPLADLSMTCVTFDLEHPPAAARVAIVTDDAV